MFAHKMQWMKVPGRMGEWLVLATVGITLGAEPTPSHMVATLSTQQTRIEVRAEAHQPRVMHWGARSGSGWRNTAPEMLIDAVFVGETRVPVRWKFDRRASRADDRHALFVYTSAAPRLQLIWEWTARASTGPVEHCIHIRNRGARELWIPLQDSFRFELPVATALGVKVFSVEKGAGSPSAVGTHEETLQEGEHWIGTSSTYAHPAKGEAREAIPFVAIERTDGTQGGWYAGVEFSGRVRLQVNREGGSLRGLVGLNPDPGPFRSRLKPGETFDTPTVFVGDYAGDVDALGNVLRPWVREVLANPETWRNPNYPLTVNNSWGSGMQVDEALARQMIGDSAELGLEMFHIDAGWFRGVGDWYPDPIKFPHGLAALADDAHRRGLKFGIWADWAQAGLDTATGALNLRDPQVRNWTVTDLPADWKPDAFKGQTIDIGEPAAHAYAQREVLRMVEDYKLDMLEHDGYVVAQGCVRSDHPHAPPDRSRLSIAKDEGSYFAFSSNSTDVSYHAVRAYYGIHEEVRKRHPGVLLEVCNDGGRMVDFGSAAHGDYFSITDSYDPLSNRRAFFDASHLLPAAMLEAYVEKWPTPTIENFRYMLRSGMLGWLTIMQNTNGWSVAEHAAAKEEIRLYRTELRSFIRDGDIYHVSARPDGVHWDGIEFWDPRRDRGVIYAFRGSVLDEAEHVFPIKGLIPDQIYRVRFQDHSAPDRLVKGHALLSAGIAVRLGIPNSSELVFLEGSSPKSLR